MSQPRAIRERLDLMYDTDRLDFINAARVPEMKPRTVTLFGGPADGIALAVKHVPDWIEVRGDDTGRYVPVWPEYREMAWRLHEWDR